jgi:hypothetical protein
MNGSFGSTAVALCEPILCLAALSFVLHRRRGAEYRFFCMFLICRITSAAILLPLLLFGGHGIDVDFAYKAYFYGYWTSFAIETVLSLLVIYSIFGLAMAPLEGIRKLGVLVFRWAACMSLAVTLGSVLLTNHNDMAFVTNLVMQLQRTESILTLCLLLFVCFAIRPLGLSYRSRVFGISLGLGLLATTNLVASAWIGQTQDLFSPINIVDGVATCAALLVWIGYFAAPESKRRIVVLPTTSPFLRWNQISMALGDRPGYVAIGGVPPELFASAELEVMRRASMKMAG